MKILLDEKKVIYALLCSGCAAISFNVAAIAAAIPAISKDLGLPFLSVAKIIPFYMIPYGIGALIYAPLTQKLSYRFILSLPLSLYALFSFFCGATHSLPLLYAGRTGMGVAGASVIPLGLLIIGQLFKKEVRGRLVGLFFSFSFIASVAGISLGGVADWRWLFFIPAALAGLTAVGIAFYPTRFIDRIHGANVDYLKSFREEDVRNVFIFIFCISFLYYGVHQWFGIYLDKEYHLSKFLISIFFIVMSLSGAAGQMIGGVLADKKGRYKACLLGILLLSGSTMFLVGRYPAPLLCLILGLVTMGWTIGHNGISTVLTDFAEEHRPQVASLNSSVRFVSGGIGFYVSSFFVEKSFGITFFCLGILMLGLGIFMKKIVFKTY